MNKLTNLTRFEAQIIVNALVQYQFTNNEEEDYRSAIEKVRRISML